MKTDDVVAAIAGQDPRPTSHGPRYTVALAGALGLLGVLVASVAFLSPRPDLIVELERTTYPVLAKFAFAAAVVVAAMPIIVDLSAPGRRIAAWRVLAVALPFAIILVLGVRDLVFSPNGAVGLEHASWLSCLWQIPALAIPAFIVLALGVRRLAPTNLVRTGAFIGVFAGGVGAIAYALHCHDDSVAFVALGYTVGILETVALGALTGPVVLRWR